MPWRLRALLQGSTTTCLLGNRSPPRSRQIVYIAAIIVFKFLHNYVRRLAKDGVWRRIRFYLTQHFNNGLISHGNR